MKTAFTPPQTLWLPTSAVALAVALLLAPVGTRAQTPAAAPVAKPALTVTVEVPTQAHWGQQQRHR